MDPAERDDELDESNQQEPQSPTNVISEPAERAQNVGQRLVQAAPDAEVVVWEVMSGTVVAWCEPTPVIAIAMPVPYGMAFPVRVSARSFVQALANHIDHGDPAIMFAGAAQQTEEPLDFSKSSPIGGFQGDALFEMIIGWLSAVADMDVDTMVLAADDDVDAPAVAMRADEVRRISEFFPFGDNEWVTMAVDEMNRVVFAGGFAIVAFSPVEVSPDMLPSKGSDRDQELSAEQ